jgi:hypothetical protein
MQAWQLQRKHFHQGATMPYDIPLGPHNTLSEFRSRAILGHDAALRNARPLTNRTAPTGVDSVLTIEPMLLVHQEQVETFRLIAAAIRRGLKALARPYAA